MSDKLSELMDQIERDLIAGGIDIPPPMDHQDPTRLDPNMFEEIEVEERYLD